MVADSQVGEDRHRPDGFDAAYRRWLEQRAIDKAWIESAPAWIADAFTDEQREALPAVALWTEAVLMAVSKRSNSAQSSLSLLSQTEKLFCLTIAEYARPGVECWPSMDRLALDVGSDRKTVRDARDRLGETGWLRVEHDRKPKRLHLTLPEEGVEVRDGPYGPRLVRSVTLTTDSEPRSVTLNTDTTANAARSADIGDSQHRYDDGSVTLTTDGSVTLNTEKQPEAATEDQTQLPTDGVSTSVQDARAREWDDSISDDAAVLAKLLEVFTTETGERPVVKR